ncbi:MAG: 50S ribosomal protein L21 [Bacteroidales bacterium]|nr:50S ribosomal protein L21 [Bacteroidales bacterium]
MYAIVDIAGQQFKVEAGKQIFVNRQAAEVGASVSYDKVLLLAGDEGGVKVGNPYVEGAAVNATVLEHCKADKVIIFKKERRKGYQKKNGHRQYLTKIQIEGIA